MSELRKLVADELAQPADPRVSEIARAIANKHGAASQAILFYGSCLRHRQLEGLMLDFYLIVSDYRAAYHARWLAVANRLIPPNVFHFEHEGLESKYAVLSEADFAHECSTEAWTVSTAARFAQPSRLVWSVDAECAARIVDIVSQAAPTLLRWSLPLSTSNSPGDLWKRAFALTFSAELRAERPGRSAALVEADTSRYEQFGLAALKEMEARRSAVPGDPALRRTVGEARRWWRRKQRRGKLYSIARLAKAGLTFSGGADYIAWKINRHAGTKIRLKPWQQRHPLLAAIILLPRLIRSGAVR